MTPSIHRNGWKAVSPGRFEVPFTHPRSLIVITKQHEVPPNEPRLRTEYIGLCIAYAVTVVLVRIGAAFAL
jgi:hypothetical protein